MLLLTCSAMAACSTRMALDDRPISSGVSRAFPADFERVAAAVDEVVETLPVNIIQPASVGERRVIRFDRPVTGSGWGESGRIVITPINSGTTRVTVAVNSRDPVQLGARSEETYADQIFRAVDARIAQHG